MNVRTFAEKWPEKRKNNRNIEKKVFAHKFKF